MKSRIARLAIAAAALVSLPAAAQSLFEELRQADSQVFDAGFNRCEMDVLERVIHPDLQFFHDKDGTEDRAGFMKSFRQYICSSPNEKPIRKLVEGSLAAFPLKKDGVLYGAFQTGAHEFYIQAPGKPLRLTAKARFAHVWLREGGQWKLHRVVSYDHREP